MRKRVIDLKGLMNSSVKAGKKWPFTILGCLLIFLLWCFLSYSSNSLVLASPLKVFGEIFLMLKDKDFYLHLNSTFLRLLAILTIAGVSGAVLAVAAASSTALERILDPFRWFFMTFPPIVMLVFLMYCFGMGSGMILIFGSVILWPVMYVNVLQACKSLDYELLEMASVYRISMKNFIRFFIIPSVIPSLISGAIQVLCNGIRVTLLAELIGAHSGIGAAISTAARNLESARLGGWAVIVLSISVIMEFVILKPFEQRAYRWKKR